MNAFPFWKNRHKHGTEEFNCLFKIQWTSSQVFQECGVSRGWPRGKLAPKVLDPALAALVCSSSQCSAMMHLLNGSTVSPSEPEDAWCAGEDVITPVLKEQWAVAEASWVSGKPSFPFQGLWEKLLIENYCFYFILCRYLWLVPGRWHHPEYWPRNVRLLTIFSWVLNKARPEPGAPWGH